MTVDCYYRNTCRACLNKGVEKVIPIPATPVGDHYVKVEECNKAQKVFPLDVYFCKSCGLIQLLNMINPEIIYSDYLYETSTSSGLAQHFEMMASSIIEGWSIDKNSLIMDIGCNDGTLLKAFQSMGMRVLGVEPAKAIAEKNNAKGLTTLNAFFDKEAAKQINNNYGSPKLIFANNVMANIDDLDKFL